MYTRIYCIDNVDNGIDDIILLKWLSNFDKLSFTFLLFWGFWGFLEFCIVVVVSIIGWKDEDCCCELELFDVVIKYNDDISNIENASFWMKKIIKNWKNIKIKKHDKQIFNVLKREELSVTGIIDLKKRNEKLLRQRKSFKVSQKKKQ